jgi:hypothetical protein
MDRPLQIAFNREKSVQPEMVGLNGSSLRFARVLSDPAQRSLYRPTSFCSAAVLIEMLMRQTR